jgi:hypothetical protein
LSAIDGRLNQRVPCPKLQNSYGSRFFARRPPIPSKNPESSLPDSYAKQYVLKNVLKSYGWQWKTVEPAETKK